jgi:hypothetical protein
MCPLLCIKRILLPFLTFVGVLLGGFSLGLMPVPGVQVRADGGARPENHRLPQPPEVTAPEIAEPY